MMQGSVHRMVDMVNHKDNSFQYRFQWTINNVIQDNTASSNLKDILHKEAIIEQLLIFQNQDFGINLCRFSALIELESKSKLIFLTQNPLLTMSFTASAITYHTLMESN